MVKLSIIVYHCQSLASTIFFLNHELNIQIEIPHGYDVELSFSSDSVPEEPPATTIACLSGLGHEP